MSPMPGRSTLITSAPIYASSCVQVGPDCTWVKSRVRTPSSALPTCPKGLVDGFGKPFATVFFAAGFFALSFTTFFDAAFDFGLILLFAFTFLLATIAVPSQSSGGQRRRGAVPRLIIVNFEVGPSYYLVSSCRVGRRTLLRARLC